MNLGKEGFNLITRFLDRKLGFREWDDSEGLIETEPAAESWSPPFCTPTTATSESSALGTELEAHTNTHHIQSVYPQCLEMLMKMLLI